MANTQRDLEGWQVVTTDEHGNIIGNDRRRSRKRGGAEHAYLQRLQDGLTFGRGDSVTMKDSATGSYSVYLIHEIRLNTLNNIVEIWAFSYLRWFELNPLHYYAKFQPELAKEDRPPEFYRDKLSEEIDKDEIYLTAELSEIWLKDFLSVANIMNESKRQEVGSNFTKGKDFFVRYICEPTGENFVPFDIVKERKLLSRSEPKGFEERLKRLSVPKTPRSHRKPKSRQVSDTNGKGPSITSIKFETDSESDEEDSDDQQPNVSRRGRRSKSPAKSVYKEESDSPSETTSPSSSAYDDAQEVSESSPALANKDVQEESKAGHPGEISNVSPSPEISNMGENESESERNLEERAFSEHSLAESSDSGYSSEEGDKPLSQVTLKKRTNKREGTVSKARKIESTPAADSRSSTASNSLARKFTKRNVVRAKKKYTPFSKRFKSVDDIPDLTELAEFNQLNDDLDVAALENKLRTPKKHEAVETIFSKIKKQLYSSHDREEIMKSESFQDFLPARENEFASIYLSIYSAIESGSATTVYVAGTPGVGKTLTVKEVIKELQRSSDQKELPLFQFVEVNGLKMVKPTDSYEVLWNKIMGERLTWGAAMESLEFYFNKVPRNKKRPVVVLLDELDALVNKTQDIMYNFFNWTTYENAKLIVIAVANTMDLPERQLGNKVSSRIGFTRIMFTGYTYEELKKIIEFRLKGMNNSFFYEDTRTGSAYVMDPEDEQEGECLPSYIKKVQLRMTDDAIEIASRKVASVSGDARRALKVCKRAAEIAEHYYMAKHGYTYDGQASSRPDINDIEDINDRDGVQTVHISHIMKALNETINSQSTTFISRLSFTGKLFLYALLKLMKKTGLQEQQLGDIVDEIRLLIEANAKNKFVEEMRRVLFHQGSETTPEQLRIVSWDFVINQLIEAGIIIKQSMKNEKISCVKLNISSEDVKKALEQDESLKGL